MKQDNKIEKQIDICAGIVLYNADVERLQQNIDSIIKQVKSLILVDNGSENISKVEKLIKSKYEEYDITIKRSMINRGIGWALNVIFNYAEEHNCEWYITLDQDSICSDNLCAEYMNIIESSIGQATCRIVDRNLGLIGNNSANDFQLQDVEYCITSGCINQTKAVKECAGYNEALFIDGIDIDLSCRLRRHDYRIIQLNYEGILHELGEGNRKKFGRINLNFTNHLPWRNYYARRNLIYVARKYYSGNKKIKLICKCMQLE